MTFLDRKQKQIGNPNELSTLPDAPNEGDSFNFRDMNANELPELPALPDLPDSSNIQPLPALPSNDFGDSFGIEAIKSSVSGDLNQTSGFNERRAIELPSLPTRNPKQTQFRPIPQEKPVMPKVYHPIIKEPVFVKLDKFKLSYEKFQEIKMKVSEIENYLIKAKTIKEKEEQEIKAWEEELKNMKNKISEIDSALFSKV